MTNDKKSVYNISESVRWYPFTSSDSDEPTSGQGLSNVWMRLRNEENMKITVKATGLKAYFNVGDKVIINRPVGGDIVCTVTKIGMVADGRRIVEVKLPPDHDAKPMLVFEDQIRPV